MLLQIALPAEHFQVSDGKDPQETSFPDALYCVFCRHHLHGHGRRERYYVNGKGETVRLLIPRRRCPECGATYTILPMGVHANKVHSAHTVASVVRSRIEEGRFTGTGKWSISRRLKGIWWRQFLQRARMESPSMCRGTLLGFLSGAMAFAASTVHLIAVNIPIGGMAEPELRAHPTILASFLPLQAVT